MVKDGDSFMDERVEHVMKEYSKEDPTAHGALYTHGDYELLNESLNKFVRWMLHRCDDARDAAVEATKQRVAEQVLRLRV